MANKKRKKAKETWRSEETITLKGKDKALVKACFARAYEMGRIESLIANGGQGIGRKPHWSRKTLISEMSGSTGEWIIEKYRDPLIRELTKIISEGQSGMYLDQAKMVKKYGKEYLSVFDVSSSGSYVTYVLGITETQYCNVKAAK